MSSTKYQTCRLECKVRLFISGPSSEVDSIGQRLGAAMVESAMGSKAREGDQTTQVRAAWVLESPLSLETAIESHLRWVQQAITPYRDFLGRLAAKGYLRVHCDIHSETDQCGFEISPDLLSTFVELGIPLEGRVHL